MVGITLADLRYRYRQFLIAVIGTAVVLAMAVLLSGLAHGFRTEVNATIGAVGADNWVLSEKANGRITSVTTFDERAVRAIRKERGVARATGVAVLPLEVMRAEDQNVTVTVIGVPIHGIGAPAVVDGRRLRHGDELVVDRRADVGVDSVVRFGRTTFHVVGRVTGRTMSGGTPVVYIPLSTAQTVLLGGQSVVTAVVTRGTPKQVPHGLVAHTPAEVEDATLETLANAVSSIDNSRSMMWVIAVIIVAALVYVSALQRVRDFAVLKALGSSSAALFGSLCLQAVIVTLIGAGLGMVLSTFMTGVFTQPVSVPTSSYTTLPVVALVVGVLASLVALRQATGADPAAAFGG
jgi:putative ABC transport system permease protein